MIKEKKQEVKKMGYISKYDTKFITYINKKYNVNFKYWDDYAIWLYYKKSMCNNGIYYSLIEKDLWEYSDFQTGTPRENEIKNNDWKILENDKYNLYTNNDSYVEYLKRSVWNDKN